MTMEQGLQYLKKNNFQPRKIYPTKLSIKYEFRIDIFRHLSFQKMYPRVPQEAIVRYAPPK